MKLDLSPAEDRTDLLAAPTAAALSHLDGFDVSVAPIDATLADTAAFCEVYEWSLGDSANCVIIAGKRGDNVRMAACMVLATTRADVNGVARRRLDARKASFAPMDEAVELTGMEYGGITPVGLPSDWPIFVDARVVERQRVVIGSGIRGSKLILPGKALAALPGAEVIEGLAG